MGENNDLKAIALRDLQLSELILGTTNDEIMQNMAAYHTQQAIEKILKNMIIQARGYGNNNHDIDRLLVDAKDLQLDIPDWIEEESYEISRWATTIRYNSNFKVNRDKISEINLKIEDWLIVSELREDLEEAKRIARDSSVKSYSNMKDLKAALESDEIED